MAIANSKVKTLWAMSGRVVDSREVLDSNGGLRVGRVDIPASMSVTTEGYTKVSYLRTSSDGTVSEYETIMEALTVYGTAPVVETKSGSGVMTFFVDGSDSSYPGFVQIDVYKEWEYADPERDPITSSDLADASPAGINVLTNEQAFGLGASVWNTGWDVALTKGCGFYAGAGLLGNAQLAYGLNVFQTVNYGWQIAARGNRFGWRYNENAKKSTWLEIWHAGNVKVMVDAIVKDPAALAALKSALA